MSLFSFSFFVFLCVGVLVYYLLPGRWQWVCLLVLSGGFYACAGPAGLLFPAVTIVTTWLGGLAMARVDRLCTVEDGFIRQAMVLLMTKAKLTVEPSGALPVAAALAGALPVRQGQKVVFVLSGGNVDPALASQLLARA